MEKVVSGAHVLKGDESLLAPSTSKQGFRLGIS